MNSTTTHPTVQPAPAARIGAMNAYDVTMPNGTVRRVEVRQFVDSATFIDSQRGGFVERFADGRTQPFFDCEAAIIVVEWLDSQAGATKPAAPRSAFTKAGKPRCQHYGAIKEFFAVAIELGLDTSEASKDRVRGAIGMLLGRPIQSRSELNGAEWAFCTNAVRMGKLYW